MNVQLNTSLRYLVLNVKGGLDDLPGENDPEIRTEAEVKEVAGLLSQGADPKANNLLAAHLVSHWPIRLDEQSGKINLLFAKMLIEAGAEFDAKQYAEMQTVAKQHKELLKIKLGDRIHLSINVLEKSSNPFLVALADCFSKSGFSCTDTSIRDAKNAESRLDSALLRYELWAKELASVKPAKK